MKHTLKYSLILIFALNISVLLGCTEKVATKQNHDKASGRPLNKSESTTLISDNFNIEELNALSLQSNSSILTKVVQPLGSYLFSDKGLDEPLIGRTDRTKDLLAIYTQNVAKLILSNSINLEMKMQLASDFSKEVFKNCTGDYPTCTRVQIIRKVPFASEIVMFHADQIGNQIASYEKQSRGSCAKKLECSALLVEYYRQYLMAYDISNRSFTEKIGLGYIKYASIYGDYFSSLSEKTQAEAEFRRHRLMFQLAFSRVKLDPKDGQLAQILDRPESFLFSRTKGSAFDDLIFWKASQLFLYPCESAPCLAKEKLGTSFKLALKTILSQRAPPELMPVPDSKGIYHTKSLDQLYLADVIEIVKKEQSEVLANFGLDTSFAEDEYLFLVNGIFNGDLSAQDADRFWLASGRDFGRLQATLEKLVKIYSVFMIGETNKFMNSIYSERAKYTSEGLIQRAVTESEQISKQWVNLKDRIESMRAFVGQSLQNFSGYRELDIKLREFRKSIKFMAVYPNMMMMMYYLSDVNYELVIRNPFFGEVKINAASLGKSLFIGAVTPWLYFGNDNYALNSYELMYALHYALKTETFTAFGNIPNLEGGNEGRPKNVDEFQYFNLVLPNTYDSEFQDVVVSLKDLRNLTKSYNFRQMIRVCSEITDPKSGGNSPLPPMAYSASDEWLNRVGTYPNYNDQMNFSELVSYTFIGPLHEINSSPGIISAAQGLFSNSYVMRLAQINSGLVPAIERAQNMIAILKDHFTKKIADEKDPIKRKELIAKYTERTAKIEKVLARAENNITGLASLWVNTNDQIRDCLEVVGNIGRTRALAIYDKEKFHLQKIYNWMAILQIVDSADGKVLGNKSFDDALRALESSSENAMLAASLKELQGQGDSRPIIQLMNESLKKVAQHPLVPEANKKPEALYKGHDEIRWTEGANPHYTYSLVDLMFRMLDYYKDGIAPNIYNNIVMPVDLNKTSLDFKKQTPLPFQESFEKFLHAASAQIGGRASQVNYLTFWDKHINFDILRGRSEALRQLYSFGKMDIYPNDCVDEMVSYTAKDLSTPTEIGEGEEQKTQPGTISPACSRKKVQRQVTAHDLTLAREVAVRSVNLMDRELNFLKEMNTEGLYAPSKLKGFALDEADVNQSQPFYDTELRKLLDLMSFTMNRARYYYNSQRNVGTLLFGIDQEVQKSIKCQYLEKVERSIRLLENYRDQVALKEIEDASSPNLFQIRYGWDSSRFLTATSETNGKVTYILRTKLQDLKVYIEKFHDGTLNFFNRSAKGESSESDGNPINKYFPSPEECKLRSETKWQ